MNHQEKAIVVSCRKSDPHAFSVQKYSNGAPWNVPGGIAPNGVSATRYLRRTVPTVSKLTPLAAWLVEHLPDYVAGNTSRPRGDLKCESRETEREMLRRTQPETAEAVIRGYDIPEDRRCSWTWRFPQIAARETDTAYWNRVARELVAAGVARVSVNGVSLELSALEGI